MSVIRIVLHNNLIFFGSPASQYRIPLRVPPDRSSPYRSTFWLRSRYPLSPELFWLVHCAFYQNHSNRIHCILFKSYQNCPTQTSSFLTPWWLERLYIDFALLMANRNMFQKSNRPYEISLRNKWEAMTSTMKPSTMTSNNIMTVSWPAISNWSDLDPHFDLGVGASFHLTCFDWYTVHFARTTQTDTLYSVQEYQISPTQASCILTT